MPPKREGIRPKSISNFEGMNLTFPFNKIIKFMERYNFTL